MTWPVLVVTHSTPRLVITSFTSGRRNEPSYWAVVAAQPLLAAAASGTMPADDRAYLEQLVAARTGLAPADAKARVDAVLQRADEAAQQAKQAAETARQAGAAFALVGALSLFIGAFIASAAAAFGGRLRDNNEGALDLRS